MWENIFKPWDKQGVIFQNIQTAHTTQKQRKEKKPYQKIGRRPKETFLQRTDTDDQ